MATRKFRAVSNIHLGSRETYIQEGEVLDWDGRSVTQHGEPVQGLPSRSFEAGIKAGMFVLVEDTTTTYRARPADVRIGPAQSAGSKDRVRTMKIQTVESDERVVGTHSQFSDHRKEMERTGGRKKMKIVVTDGVDQHGNSIAGLEPQEGELVGKLRPAVMTTDVSSADYHRELRRTNPIEGSGLEVERVAADPVPDKTRYTGDVSRPVAGDSLRDIFSQADAAVGHTPEPGLAGTGPEVHDLKAKAARAAATAARAAAEAAAAQAEAVRLEAEALAQEAAALEAARRQEADAVSSLPDDEEEVTSAAIQDAKFQAARSFLPDFEWDMGRHWRTRVSAALKADSTTLLAIMAVESDTVKRHVQAALDR